MSQTFVLQNQDKLFFGKSKEWVDGYDANSLFKTLFKDEAINQMVEISSKDYKQRVKVITCDLNEKGLPILDPEMMPAPLPKVPKGQKPTEDLFTEPAPVEVEIVDDVEEEEELEFTTDDSAHDDDAHNDKDNNQQPLI